jgi:amino acid transporter
VNVVGIQASARVTALCTAAEILGLALIVGGGVASGRFGEGVLAAPHAGVLGGAALIFFVYTGFEGIANLAEEAERPRRDLPRALLWSGAITTAFYVAVAIAVVALVEPEALAASDAPLATAGAAAAPWLAAALAGIALFSTGNTALITLVVASRLLFAMARAGDMPPLFARLLPRRQTPWLAALAMLAAAGSLVPLGEVALVGSVSSLSTLVAFAVVASAVIALRRRDPGRERPFRIPFAVAGVPLPAALAIAAVALLATRFPPAAYAVVAAGFGLGALLHLSRGWWSRS